MDKESVYFWLDVIKKDIQKDLGNQKKIEAIEKAQLFIREKVTGVAENED